MTQSNTKTPVVFCVGIALLCLFMFSLYLSGGMYARYATTASGSDGARVAKFAVEYDPADGKTWFGSEQVTLGSIQPGGEVSVEFNLTNNSEVLVAFKVTMTNLTGNLPLQLTGGSNVFTAPVEMGETDTVAFNVIWPDDQSDPAAAGKTDVLRFDFEVIQVD